MQIELSDFEWSEVFLQSQRCLAPPPPLRRSPSFPCSSLIIKEKTEGIRSSLISQVQNKHEGSAYKPHRNISSIMTCACVSTLSVLTKITKLLVKEKIIQNSNLGRRSVRTHFQFIRSFIYSFSITNIQESDALPLSVLTFHRNVNEYQTFSSRKIGGRAQSHR